MPSPSTLEVTAAGEQGRLTAASWNVWFKAAPAHQLGPRLSDSSVPCLGDEAPWPPTVLGHPPPPVSGLLSYASS